jgi:hypothetical protein
LAQLWKATKRPFALMEGIQESKLAWVPSLARLTSVTIPVTRSLRKTSWTKPFASGSTMSLLLLW